MSSRERISYRFQDFELRPGDGELLRRGRRIPVEPKVLGVILHLLQNTDRVVSKAELLEAVWPGLAVVDGVVHRCVSRARRTLGDHGTGPHLITTRGRSGYQFVGEVTAVRSAVPSRGPGPGDRAPDVAPAAHSAGFLVGRTEELRRMRDAIRRLVEAGAGSVLTLVGGPGMGKSRLLETLAREAELGGVRVLRSPCQEVAGASAFQPWIRVLHDLAIDGDAALSRPSGVAAHEVADAMPDLLREAIFPEETPVRSTHPVDTVSPELQRGRFFQWAERILVDAARERATAVVIDDLHCGDEATLDFWRIACQICARAPLLLVGGYRDTELRGNGALAAMDAQAFRDDRVARLELDGLKPSETRALVAPLIGGEDKQALSLAIHTRAEGNPFFALELAKHASRLVGDGSGGELERFLEPENPVLTRGIRAVVALGLEALDQTTREILEAASIIGRQFDVSGVRALCDHRAEKIVEALDSAARGEVIDPDPVVPGRSRFRHILIRDVLYDSTAPGVRRGRHLRYARYLVATRGSALEQHYDELACHFFEAAPDGGAEDAVFFAELAAEQAARSLAFDNAARSYERAITALRMTSDPSPGRICSLTLELADSWNRAGNDQRAGEVYREAAAMARTLRESEMLARAAVGLAVRFGQPVDFGAGSPAPRALLEEALAALRDRPGRQRALVLACLAFSSYAAADHDTAEDLAMQSEEEARAHGDPYSVCVALVARNIVAVQPGHLDSSADMADRLIEAAGKSEIEEMEVVGHTYRVFRYLDEGRDGAELEAAMVAREEVAGRTGLPQGMWWSHVLRAAVAMMRGDWKTSEQRSLSARDLALRSTNANQDLVFRSQQAQVLIHRGDLGELFRLSIESLEMYPHLQVTIAGHRALLAAVGEREECVAFARQWHDKDLATALQPANWLVEASYLVELTARIGDRVLAGSLYRFLEPHEGRNVVVGQGVAYKGPVVRLLGQLAAVLGRHEDSARHFEEALARARAFGATPWVARARIDHAYSLLTRGGSANMDGARMLLEQAHEEAYRVGAEGLIMEIQALESGGGLG